MVERLGQETKVRSNFHHCVLADCLMINNELSGSWGSCEAADGKGRRTDWSHWEARSRRRGDSNIQKHLKTSGTSNIISNIVDGQTDEAFLNVDTAFISLKTSAFSQRSTVTKPWLERRRCSDNCLPPLQRRAPPRWERLCNVLKVFFIFRLFCTWSRLAAY